MSEIVKTTDAVMCFFWITTYTLVFIGTKKYKYPSISPITQAVVAPFEFAVTIVHLKGMVLNYALIAYFYWSFIEIAIITLIVRQGKFIKQRLKTYILFIVLLTCIMVPIVKLENGRALSVVIIALWAVLCFGYLKDVYFLRPLFTGRNSFAVNELFKDWGILYRLLCYLITALLSFALISLMPNKNIPMFTRFGPRTLQVFFWHWPLGLVFVKCGINDMLCTTPWGQFGWLMIGVVVSYIACIPIFSFPCTNVIKACREIKDDK